MLSGKVPSFLGIKIFFIVGQNLRKKAKHFHKFLQWKSNHLGYLEAIWKTPIIFSPKKWSLEGQIYIKITILVLPLLAFQK